MALYRLSDTTPHNTPTESIMDDTTTTNDYAALLRRLSVAEKVAADLNLPWPLLESAYWLLIDAKQAVREFEAHADRHEVGFLEEEER